MDAGLFPVLSAPAQALVRVAYGLLMLATLVQALPEARRFFVSERWGGYAASARDVDLIQNPAVMPIVLAVWLGSAVAVVAGWGGVWPALVNLVLCRYFFIHMRWKGVLRGMGAPGFLAYWMALAVFLLEYSARYAPEMRSLALLVLQVDFALIMLSAGVYKFTAGYPRNHGMELGLCNPMWGYWWRFYVKRAPQSALFWMLNQLAWGTEVVAAVLMLVPPTRLLGSTLIVFSFLFILTQIRLGFLCEMVIVAALLFVPSGSIADGWIRDVAATLAAAVPQPHGSAAVALVNTVLGGALWAYLLLLPVAHAGLYYNFYARRAFPAPLQRILDRYVNLFGLIIWRVFSVDLVNFFIAVYREPRAGGERVPVARLGSWPRFNHVGEMICLTSLFTTLKYYPSNEAVFRERLLRYARTIPRPSSDVLVFEYVSVVKGATGFDWVKAAEYRVDADAATVEERIVRDSFSARTAHAVSPVHEGLTPGSYAPARR